MAGVGFPCPAGMAIPEIPEPAEPAGAVRRDDIFIKENEALNLIFTRIIRPAFVAGAIRLHHSSITGRASQLFGNLQQLDHPFEQASCAAAVNTAMIKAQRDLRLSSWNEFLFLFVP